MKNESMLQARITLKVHGEITRLDREEIEKMVEYYLFKRHKRLFEPIFDLDDNDVLLKPRKFLKPPLTEEQSKLQDEITLIVDGEIRKFPRIKIQHIVEHCVALRRRPYEEYHTRCAIEEALAKYRHLFKK